MGIEIAKADSSSARVMSATGMLARFLPVLICVFVFLTPGCSTIGVYSSEPGATVILDARDTGFTTPAQLWVRHLSVGRHRVTVRKEGYLTKTPPQEFEVERSTFQIFWSWWPPLLLENLFDDLWKAVTRGGRMRTFQLKREPVGK